MAKKLSPTEILALPMGENDADAKTVRDYLKALLRNVWEDGESFSGKRPFGNSGWESELYVPLVEAEAIDGHFDEEGYLADCDECEGRRLINAAIGAL